MDFNQWLEQLNRMTGEERVLIFLLDLAELLAGQQCNRNPRRTIRQRGIEPRAHLPTQ